MSALINYETNEPIRTASAEEVEASAEAALVDGGAGVIAVEIDGVSVSCYVD